MFLNTNCTYQHALWTTDLYIVRVLSNYFKVIFYLSTSKDSEVLRNTEAGSPTCKKYEEKQSPHESMTSQNSNNIMQICYSHQLYLKLLMVI